MPKTHELRLKATVTSDEPQAQRSREMSRTRSEVHVSEVSKGQPGGTEKGVEVQQPEWDGDHMTIAPSNSGTVRPAQDESRTDMMWGTAPTPGTSKGKEKATPVQAIQKSTKPSVAAAPLPPNYLTQSHFAEFVLNFNHKWTEQTSRFDGIKRRLAATEKNHSRTQCSEACDKPEETLARDYPNEDNHGERGSSPRGQAAEMGTRGVRGRPSNVQPMPRGNRHKPAPVNSSWYLATVLHESKEDEWQREVECHRHQLAQCDRVEQENWENRLAILTSFHTLAESRRAREGHRSRNSDQFKEADCVVREMHAALDCYQATRANDAGRPRPANDTQMGVNPEYNAPHPGSTSYRFATHEGSEAYRAQAQANYSPVPPSHAEGTPQLRFDQMNPIPNIDSHTRTIELMVPKLWLATARLKPDNNVLTTAVPKTPRPD